VRTSLFSGAGNLFVMLDGFEEGPISDPAGFARELCAGGGPQRPDGLVLLLPSTRGADCAMQIYNRDGSRPEACGNGLRCAAKLAVDRARVDQDAFTIETDSGIRKVRVSRQDGRVVAARVEMGRARIVERETRIQLDRESIVATLVDVGNPHCVLLVEDEREAPVGILGPALERHEHFSAGTNVEFLARRSGAFHLRVWERGVGETLACGSGACAAAAVACDRGFAGFPVRLELRGGTLAVDADSSGTLELSGPVRELA
jgi:diaminopimelate epimerase